MTISQAAISQAAISQAAISQAAINRIQLPHPRTLRQMRRAPHKLSKQFDLKLPRPKAWGSCFNEQCAGSLSCLTSYRLSTPDPNGGKSEPERIDFLDLY